MAIQILDQAAVDLSNSAVNSPTENGYYFFFAKASAWADRYAVIDITQSNPAQITVDPNLNISIGDIVTIQDVQGMSAINGLTATVSAVAANVIDVSIDTSAFSAFTEGGYVSVSRTTKDEIETQEEVRQSVAGMVQVNGDSMCHVVPRINWTSTTVYDAFSPSENMDGKQFYVLNSANNLYLCVDNAGGGLPSTAEPTSTRNDPIQYADGYVWKYIQSVSNDDQTKFLTADWCPVRPQNGYKNSVKNGIEAIKVVSRGSGYKNSDTINIVGDGENAFALIGRFTTNGAIVATNVQQIGQNYTWASAYVDSATGSGAVLEPVIAWGYGQVQDPTHVLRARHVSFSVEIDGTEDGQLYVGDIRSIGMIRMPQKTFTEEFIDTRSSIGVQSNGNSFAVGSSIVGQISGTTAIVAGTSENEIKCLEIQGVGFEVGEVVNDGSVNSAIISSFTEYDNTALDEGNIVFIDNFASVYTRNSGQVDTWNFVIGY